MHSQSAWATSVSWLKNHRYKKSRMQESCHAYTTDTSCWGCCEAFPHEKVQALPWLIRTRKYSTQNSDPNHFLSFFQKNISRSPPRWFCHTWLGHTFSSARWHKLGSRCEYINHSVVILGKYIIRIVLL